MAATKRLLYAFPRTWRARYATELSDLLGQIEQERGRVPLRAQLDLVRAGLCVRADPWRRAIASRAARPLVTRCAIAGLAVIAAFAIVGTGSFSGPGQPAPAATSSLPVATAGSGAQGSQPAAAGAAAQASAKAAARAAAAVAAALEAQAQAAYAAVRRTANHARSIDRCSATSGQGAELTAARKMAVAELAVEVYASKQALADARDRVPSAIVSSQ